MSAVRCLCLLSATAVALRDVAAERSRARSYERKLGACHRGACAAERVARRARRIRAGDAAVQAAERAVVPPSCCRKASRTHVADVDVWAWARPAECAHADERAARNLTGPGVKLYRVRLKVWRALKYGCSAVRWLGLEQ